jgi:hypothetical protein
MLVYGDAGKKWIPNSILEGKVPTKHEQHLLAEDVSGSLHDLSPGLVAKFRVDGRARV